MTAPAAKAAHPATRERALRDVLIQVAARVLNLALGIVVTVLVVRTLGRSGYGQWSTIFVVIQLVGYFTNLGMESVVVREAAAHPEEASDWVGALIVLRLVLSIPTLLGGLIVMLAIQQSHAMLIAGLVLLAEYPLSVGSSLQVVHALRMRNTVPMVVLTINSVVWGAAVLVIHETGGGIVALAVAFTATTFLTAMIQAFAALRLARFALRPSRRAIRRLLHTGSAVGVVGLLIIAYGRIDQLIVFELAGSRAAGLYGAVYRVLEQAHFVPVSVLTTLAPVIAAAWPDQPERMMHTVRLAAEFLLIGSLGAVAFVIVAAERLVRLVFGADFVAAAPALPVLAGAFVFMCLGYLTGNLLLVTGNVRRWVSIAVVALAVNVLGNLLLVPRYGFMAAAWITLVTEVVVVAFSVWLLRPALAGHGLALGRMVRIVLAAGALCLALTGLRSIGASLVVLVAAALILYPALLLGLRALDLDALPTLRQMRGSAAA